MRRLVLALLIALIALVLTTSAALAFDPGKDNNVFPPGSDVPQGPNHRACLNEGGILNPQSKGVPNAIAAGGQVHCPGIHILS